MKQSVTWREIFERELWFVARRLLNLRGNDTNILGMGVLRCAILAHESLDGIDLGYYVVGNPSCVINILSWIAKEQPNTKIVAANMIRYLLNISAYRENNKDLTQLIIAFIKRGAVSDIREVELINDRVTGHSNFWFQISNNLEMSGLPSQLSMYRNFIAPLGI